MSGNTRDDGYPNAGSEPKQAGSRNANEYEPEREKGAFSHFKKIILYAVCLIVLLAAVNPSLIPFIPDSWREKIRSLWGGLFGDISEITHIIHFNWLMLFRLAAMVLIVMIAVNVITFILHLIRTGSGRTKSIISMLESAIKYLSVIVAILWGLAIIGVNVGTIFAGVGVTALIIGFGAESLIADLMTGIFLVFESQFGIGDIIEIGDFRGEVVKIGIRTTYVRDISNNIKIINNSEIRNVLNRSSNTSFACVDVPVGYNERLTRVEALLNDLLPRIYERHSDIFISEPRYVGVQELGESSVLLRVVGEIREEDIYNAPRILNREIKLALDDAGIEIPFRQLVVHQAEDR